MQFRSGVHRKHSLLQLAGASVRHIKSRQAGSPTETRNMQRRKHNFQFSSMERHLSQPALILSSQWHKILLSAYGVWRLPYASPPKDHIHTQMHTHTHTHTYTLGYVDETQKTNSYTIISSDTSVTKLDPCLLIIEMKSDIYLLTTRTTLGTGCGHKSWTFADTVHVLFCITVLSEGPVHSNGNFPHLILYLPNEEHACYMFSSQFWLRRYCIHRS